MRERERGGGGESPAATRIENQTRNLRGREREKGGGGGGGSAAARIGNQTRNL